MLGRPFRHPLKSNHLESKIEEMVFDGHAARSTMARSRCVYCGDCSCDSLPPTAPRETTKKAREEYEVAQGSWSAGSRSSCGPDRLGRGQYAPKMSFSNGFVLQAFTSVNQLDPDGRDSNGL